MHLDSLKQLMIFHVFNVCCSTFFFVLQFWPNIIEELIGYAGTVDESTLQIIERRLNFLINFFIFFCFSVDGFNSYTSTILSFCN